MKKIIQLALAFLSLAAAAQQVTPRIRVDGFYFDSTDFVTDDDIYMDPGTLGQKDDFTRDTLHSIGSGTITITGTGDTTQIARGALGWFPNIYSSGSDLVAKYLAAGITVTGTGTEAHTTAGGSNGTFPGIIISDPTNQYISMEVASGAPFRFHEIALTTGPVGWGGSFNDANYPVKTSGIDTTLITTVNGFNPVTGFMTASVIRDFGTYGKIRPILNVTSENADGKYHKYVIDLKPFLKAQANAGNTVIGANLAAGVWQFYFVYYTNFQDPTTYSFSSTGFNLKFKNVRVGFYGAPPVIKAGSDTLSSDVVLSAVSNSTSNSASNSIGVTAKARDITLTLSDPSFKLSSAIPVFAGTNKIITASLVSTVVGLHTSILTLTDNESIIARTVTLTGTVCSPTVVAITKTSNTVTGVSTLTASTTTTGVSYQWWTNNGSLVSISGANTSTYETSVSGIYTASATVGVCQGVGNNVTVTTVTGPVNSTSDFQLTGVTVYPNPLNGTSLNIAGLTSNALVDITNNGATVLSTTISVGTPSIPVNLVPGLYIITIQSAGKFTAPIKLVIQ